MPDNRHIAVFCSFVAVGLLVIGCSSTASGRSSDDGNLSPYAGMSEEEYLDAYNQLAADMFQLQNPPPATFKRYVEADEAQPLFESCLEEAGFTNEIDTDDKKHDKSYYSAKKRAQYLCFTAYPPPYKYSVKGMDDDAIKSQYKWTMKYVIPCLAAFGYQVGEDAPSEQTFIAQWKSGEEQYFPVAEVAAKYGDAAVEKVEDKCLQQAPESVMYGGMSIAEWKKLGRGDWWTGE